MPPFNTLGFHFGVAAITTEWDHPNATPADNFSERLNTAETHAKTDVLYEMLHLAITRNDVAMAGDAFQQAFWHKVELKPDWLHLYRAIERGDRKLCNLLTDHGATLTAAQAQCSAELMGKQWQEMRFFLASKDIETDFSGKTLDTALLAEMADFAAAQDGKYKLGITETDRAAWEQTLREKFTAAVLGNDAELIRLFSTRGIRVGETLDVSHHINQFLSSADESATEKAIAFLKNIDAQGVRVAPVVLSSDSIITQPSVIARLDTLGVLAESNAPFSGLLLKMMNENNFENLLPSLQSLLRLPATPAVSPEITGGFRNVETALSREKFLQIVATFDENDCFKSDGWSGSEVDRFGKMALATPGFETMGQKLVTLAAVKDFRGMTPATIISSAPLELIDRAIDAKVIMCDADMTLLICKRIALEIEDGKTFNNLGDFFRKMRNSRYADFSKVDPMDFLGSKIPGVAKALLDAEIVLPENISFNHVCKKYFEAAKLHQLPRKSREAVEIVVKKDHPMHAYTELYCQLLVAAIDERDYKSAFNEKDYESPFQRAYFYIKERKGEFNINMTYRPLTRKPTLKERMFGKKPSP